MNKELSGGEDLYGFAPEVFIPPETFTHHEQVVLMAYLVSKLRNQGTLPTIEDAYHTALTQFKENPGILREIYIEYMKKLAAHVSSIVDGNNQGADMTAGVDSSIIKSFEAVIKNQKKESSAVDVFANIE